MRPEIATGTVLTFDFAGALNGSTILQADGDNVSATTMDQGKAPATNVLPFDRENFNASLTLPSPTIIDVSSRVVFGRTNLFPAATQSHLLFEFSSLPVGDSLITIDIETGGSDGDAETVDVDNVGISQDVLTLIPEPGSLILLVGGLAGLSASSVLRHAVRHERHILS